MLESVFDLPTHVFVVHAPVVLIPGVAAATVAVAVRPTWRARYGLPLLVATAVTLVATLLAVKTGQEFDELLDGQAPTEDHQNYAETTRLFVALWFLSMVGLVVSVRRVTLQTVVLGLTGLAVVLASISTYWVVRTGHEGARITWDGTVPTDE